MLKKNKFYFFNQQQQHPDQSVPLSLQPVPGSHLTNLLPSQQYNSQVHEPTERSLDRDQVSNSSFESTQSILRGLDQDPDSTVGGSQSSVLSDRLVWLF